MSVQPSIREANSKFTPSAPSEREDDADTQKVAADLAFVLERLAERANQHKLWEVEHLITVAAFAAGDIVPPSKRSQ
jgi:hypothetical protein